MTTPAAIPVIRIVTQRTEGDCGICCLAMYLPNVSYEDVLAAAVSATGMHRLHRRGMYYSQVRITAQALGYSLRRKRKWDMASDSGIIRLEHKDGAHVVVLREGLIFDPSDGAVWTPGSYFATEGTPKVLYTVGG